MTRLEVQRLGMLRQALRLRHDLVRYGPQLIQLTGRQQVVDNEIALVVVRLNLFWR
jgi:hypothetical protein